MGRFSKSRSDVEEQKKPLPSWSRSSTSSTSTAPSDITFTRERGCSKLTVFCAVFSVLMVGLGSAAGIYFGFLSDQLRSLRVDDLRVFRGQLRLTSGDSYSRELADPSTAEYVRKAGFYRTKLDSIFKHSIYKSAFVGTEILGLDGHPEEDLIVHFNLRVDTRKIPVDAGDLYIILAEELRAGTVLNQYEIDHDSLQIQERTNVMESLPPDLDPLVDLQTTPRSTEVTEVTLRPRQCEPLEVTFCSHMPYNMTSYPNVLGHVDLREINEHLISFREVVDSECFRLAHDFVCQLLQPACMEDQMVLPCRDFCHDFYSRCNPRLPEKFVDRILCDKFPAHGDQQCLSRPGCVRDLELAGHGARVCDGTPDCTDGADEAVCPQCPPGLTRCDGERSCVPSAALCDGHADCEQAGDERGCLGLDARQTESDSAAVEGFLTYNGWGRRHHICAGEEGQDGPEEGAPLGNLSSACALLSYRNTELVESRLVAGDASPNATEFVQLQGLSEAASTFQPSQCASGGAVYVRCSELACGVAPHQTALLAERPARATAADFPWHARLLRDGQHLCDATLVHNQWLVSSAACFEGRPRTRWRAEFGSPRIGSEPPYRQARRITGMVRSPLGGSTITLLRLATPTEDSDQVRPICVDGEEPGKGDITDCYTIGWNRTDANMRYVPLSVSQDSVCLNGTAGTNSSMCARPRAPDALCEGTEVTGAPLVCRAGGPAGAWRLVGVAVREHCPLAGPDGRRAFDAVAANDAWMRTSMATFVEAPPAPAPAPASA
ncbi:atrial natriuretic peptide-converting enzyme-like isoform X2 [Pollicipes pollicipes]|uniref:atrial natriuretic peptide-converting enzyme-like isoform X2 n=1 Tax=Pollicipes pollicipes TaxID=41117 RepID=UPI001884B159|nr:atrial natriuretic peptide-converting enzyme-like isoform X2 [Pollicipes pollicipes]XP_037068089.1 atrial natriuretic peptide-converting enzyme-like isoform X2 [Pollicipes pollicipes]XP_037068090.1 atrial natriuretic peptide-converting enzyme-like isoform X2 [Pollicipes pollicipes]